MSLTVRDRMDPNLPLVAPTQSASSAAAVMRDRDAGAVLVVYGDEVFGLVTDRDLAIGVIADATDPRGALVRDACPQQLCAVAPDDPLDDAVAYMRNHDVARVLVVEHGEPVGLLSLEDVPDAPRAVAEP